MKKTDESIIEITEDTELIGTGVILEKGDKVRIMTEAGPLSGSFDDIKKTYLLAIQKLKEVSSDTINLAKASNALYNYLDIENTKDRSLSKLALNVDQLAQTVEVRVAQTLKILGEA